MAFVYSTVLPKPPALYNASELVLDFKIPSYVIYEHYSSNGSRSPDDVTESQDRNFRFITLKVSKKKGKNNWNEKFQVKW